MLKSSYCILALTSLATTALAEPAVYTFDDETDTNILLSNVDPLLPNIHLGTDYYANAYNLYRYLSPLIIEPGASCGMPGAMYDTQVPSTILFQNGSAYNDQLGRVIDDSLPGWFDTFASRCESGEYVPALPRAYGDGSPPDPCEDCPPDVLNGFGDGEVRFIPFRWKLAEDADWTYGWVAFRVLVETRNCYTCIPGYPAFVIDSAQFDYVAIGLETTPNTPIFAGGGLCPADMNFDAELNFFDVSAYLELFGSGDLAADMNDDGDLNFFDVSEFLGYFNNDCGL